MIKKSNIPVAYKLFKFILGPLFKFYYKPKIVNKDYLNIDGSMIVCGNHKHIMDQCLTIIATKKIIYYMAKKEYFEGKTAWFFKSVGCIPVDRSIKDSNAKDTAIDLLRNGKLIGIFPEGTRNNLKDDTIKYYYETYFSYYKYKKFKKKLKKFNLKYTQIICLENLYLDDIISLEEFKNNFFNVDCYLKKIITESEYNRTLLIPIKYGTVSMAKKTDSYIVPFAIKGDYRFRSKNLTIIYGKPFKVTKMDIVEANKLLEDTIIKLML